MSARVIAPSCGAPPYGAVAQKWRDLAERRRAHFVELYRSGRWRHYYTEEQFLVRMREVIYAAEAWAQLAKPPSERVAVPAE
jgi:uncharacterized repeat protein (TIGR03809 family)